MAHPHHYAATLAWTGAAQGSTRDYNGYSREYSVEIPGKPALRGSADAAFRGDPALYNPEDLLLIALSACHLLSYLALGARLGVEVLAYRDRATGTMAVQRQPNQKIARLRFTEVVLHPEVTIAAGADAARALALHEQAQAECFIANSVNFPVRHEATILKSGDKAA
jgi:organic hydroperoxide reductase OsmC/OhrA